MFEKPSPNNENTSFNKKDLGKLSRIPKSKIFKTSIESRKFNPNRNNTDLTERQAMTKVKRGGKVDIYAMPGLGPAGITILGKRRTEGGKFVGQEGFKAKTTEQEDTLAPNTPNLLELEGGEVEGYKLPTIPELEQTNESFGKESSKTDSSETSSSEG